MVLTEKAACTRLMLVVAVDEIMEEEDDDGDNLEGSRRNI